MSFPAEPVLSPWELRGALLQRNPWQPPACTCGIGGHDHSADCAVEVEHSLRPGPPIPTTSVIVINGGGRVLLGLRNSGDWAGIWGTPGGKADEPGSMRFNAVRELYEETGIAAWASNLVQVLAADEHINKRTGQSYPMSYYVLHATDFEVASLRVMEPHKFDRWEWFLPTALPEPLFEGVKAVLLRCFS